MILLLHNRYRVPGGEERAVEDLAWLIREHLGEEAEVFERDSSTLSQRRAAEGLLRGGLDPDKVARRGTRTGARVVHAHNVNPTLGLARARRRARGRRPRRPAPAQLPARVRRGHVLHPRRGLHALPRPQHAAGRAAQLPRRIAGRVGRLRRLACALAGQHRRPGRPLHRPERLRPPAPARSSARRSTSARACCGRFSASSRKHRAPPSGVTCSTRAASATRRASPTPWSPAATPACRWSSAGDGPAAGELQELAAGADVRFTGPRGRR